MIDWIREFHGEFGVFVTSILAGTFVAASCGMIGCFIVLRRLSFLSDALAHAMLTGVIAGYLIVKILTGAEPAVPAMIIGALISGIATVSMISFVTRVSRIKQDTAIGIMYTGIFAIGGFVISLKAFGRYIHKDLYHLIIGDVLAVSTAELWMLAVILIFVFGFIVLFFRHLQLTSFDPVMAAAIGIPVVFVDYGLTISTSLVVVGGVTIVGVILVVALMITPAAAAYLLFDKMKPMLIASAVIGVGSYWLGYLVALYFGVAPGSAVVVTLTLVFLVILVVAPRYGLVADWLRKRRMVPQTILEDILGSILKSDQARSSEASLYRQVSGTRSLIKKGIDFLLDKDWLIREGQQLVLTASGKSEATRVQRAHRLWETYLEKAGTPQAELHSTAHILEHVNDQAALDYLDDKLGHPTHDPHGSEIPRDDSELMARKFVLLSWLREGHRAKVTKLGESVDDLGIQVGDLLRVGPRLREGEIWSITTKSNQRLELNHDQADEVTVEMVLEDKSAS